MGCSMSTVDTSNLPSPGRVNNRVQSTTMELGSRKGGSLQDVFLELDSNIARLEKECPGPRLSTIQAWIDYLEMTRDGMALKLMGDDGDDLGANPDGSSRPDGHDRKFPSSGRMKTDATLSQDKNDTIKVRQMALKLGIVSDSVKAKQYEDFFAKISTASLDHIAVDIYSTMIEHCKKRASALYEDFTKLKNYYSDLDGVLTTMTGGAFMSSLEQKLDKELEKLRIIRDKLGTVVEQWRISSILLQAAAKSSLQAVDNWTIVIGVKSAADKINVCLDCRQNLQNSMMAFSAAQNALPQVEIPHVTPRQLSEIEHINLYLITDLPNIQRLKQIRTILEIYQRNTELALKWLHSTYEKTLAANFREAETNVGVLTKKLRDERLKFFDITSEYSDMPRKLGK